MILQERIDLMVEAGNYLTGNSAEWNEIKVQASHKNGWFTPEFIQHAADQMAENYLQKNILQNWADHYHLTDSITTKNVGIVMAGNIPMVGFHDMLSAFISGHYQTVKMSSKDDLLLKHLIQFLYSKNVEIQNHISFADMLKGCDAYIATGGNNAANSFEEYFGKYPNIIRKNKTSVAILTGEETEEELKLLADDIHLYFGLGCRSITKIYVPTDYDFVPLIQSFKAYSYFAYHHKYKNNYDYQLSITLLNNVYYMTNESTLLIESKNLFSPISQLYYEYYDDLESVVSFLNTHNDVQCITGKGFLAFGDAQKPDIFSYADAVDTMEFLLTL